MNGMAKWLLLVLSLYAAAAWAAGPTVLTLSGRNQSSESAISLTADERVWLAEKRTLTVAVYGKEITPLSLSYQGGDYRGINADYLSLLKKTLNINVVIEHYDNKDSAFKALQAGEVDVVLTSSFSGDKISPPFVATLPLLRGYPTLVIRSAELMTPLSDQDSAVKIAVTQNQPQDDIIASAFPQAKVTIYPDNYQALSSVANKENDYFLGSNLAASFIISRDYFYTLNMARFWNQQQAASQFVVLENQQVLLRIINTFITSISETTHDQISQAWIGMRNLNFLSHPLKLAAKEDRWVEKHPVLRVLVNPYYGPFTLLDDNHEIRGLTGDILNLIQLQTGLKFVPVVANSNGEMADLVRQGGWDILSSVTYSPEREDELLFTQPFITTPFVLVTRAGGIEKSDAKLRIAIPAYHALSDKLKSQYPHAIWVVAENSSTALSKLMQGEVDAVISTQLAAEFIIDHFYPHQLVFNRIPDEPAAQISFALPRSSPELQSVLNKALANIPVNVIHNTALKWIKVPDVKLGTWNLYNRPFYLVVGLSVLLVLSSLLWGANLLRANRRNKKSQAALEYELGFRQTLSNSIPVPVYVVTAEGELESYNKALSTFFTAEYGAALPYSLFDRRNPLAEVFLSVQQQLQAGLEPDQVVTQQLTLNNGQEERMILHWLTLCRMPEGKPAMLLCGWQDVTESRFLMKALQTEKDKAIEASRAKSSFLATMSHEIRTPVSAIMGFLELLATHRQSPEQDKESVQLAYSTAQSLIGLIGDVLDMEKIESGHFELLPEWVFPQAIIDTTVANFVGQATQKNIQLTVNSQITSETALWLDPQAVRQILNNLLSNAIKFTRDGQVSVEASTQPEPDGRVRLMLQVSDTGTGIGAEEQKHLFRPFSQASEGKKRTGSGLGLTICREIIERMAGDIILTSKEGQGTRVKVSVVTDGSTQNATVFEEPQLSAESTASLRILIADDHPANRLLLCRQLLALGYQVDEAEDGVQALDLIHQHDYDLLITDLNMPNMDGITLTRRIRETDQQTVIWGLTANAQTDEQQRCLQAGMNMCLFKPVNLFQLKTAFSELNVPSSAMPLGEFIDMPSLEARSLGDKALMHQLLEIALRENEKGMVAILNARQAGDREGERHQLHQLKGAAQILGAEKLQYLIRQLENSLAEYSDKSLTEQGISAVKQEVEALNQAMRNFMKAK